MWLLRNKRSLRSSCTPHSTCKVAAVKGAFGEAAGRPLTGANAGASAMCIDLHSVDLALGLRIGGSTDSNMYTVRLINIDL